MIDLRLGDCLEVMKTIEDNSIDAVICDLPYGTTACKWDTIIPFEKLWFEYERLIKPNGAIVLFASQPFTSALIMSNPKLFKYDLTWLKERPSNPALAKKRPLNYKEDILLFYKKQPTYNPQMTLRDDKNKRNNKNEKFNTESSAKLGDSFKKTGMDDYCYPKNFIKVNVQRGLHPTQKPLNLLEYLVKTYTNENDTILDNTMGSGTTMLACKNLNRNGIGIEMDEEYFNIASERVGEKRKRD
jgi:site-specific DNA-methyltransferase (adenine-specific)